jgi:hypothetical protein
VQVCRLHVQMLDVLLLQGRDVSMQQFCCWCSRPGCCKKPRCHGGIGGMGGMGGLNGTGTAGGVVKFNAVGSAGPPAGVNA